MGTQVKTISWNGSANSGTHPQLSEFKRVTTAPIDTSAGLTAVTNDGTKVESQWVDFGENGYFNEDQDLVCYYNGGLYLRKWATSNSILWVKNMTYTVFTQDITIGYTTEHGITPDNKTVTITAGKKYYLTADDLPTLTATGYTHTGWALSDGTAVSAGDTITADTTLVAVWEVNAPTTEEISTGKAFLLHRMCSKLIAYAMTGKWFWQE